MLTKLIAESGKSRLHREALSGLIVDSKGVIRVSSPYITDRGLLDVMPRRRVQLLTSLVGPEVVSGATSLPALRSLLELGVQCRATGDRARLHAKVYIFGEQFAVVSSANLTHSGLDENIEVGVQLRGNAVLTLTQWFDGLWGQSRDINDHELSEWETQTATLRAEFAMLRRKMRAKKKLPGESNTAVSSPNDLKRALSKASRVFICNTNRRFAPHVENRMRERGLAAVWETFRNPDRMREVETGDLILMFKKGVGIIGIGKARSGCEILKAADAGRILPRDENSEPEWRIPVDWLAWVDSDVDAFRFTMPNGSFLSAEGERYSQLRESIRRHFLREE